MVDNWKWDDVNKEQKQNNQTTEVAANENAAQVEDQTLTPAYYLSKIPKEKSEIKALSEERNDAYYQLGVLYATKIEAYDEALDRFNKLLTMHPSNELEQMTLYQMYKIYLKTNRSAEASQIAERIKKKYPNSNYAKIIENPNAVLTNDGSFLVSYEKFYQQYDQGDYVQTLKDLDKIIPTIFGDQIKPKYELLRATVVGKLKGIDAYQKAMQEVAEKYPDTEEGKEAQRILTKEIALLKKKKLTYDLFKNLKMVYVVDFPLSEESKDLQSKLKAFAEDRAHTGISFTTDMYDENTVFLVIHGIRSGDLAKSAQIYLEIEKKYNIKKQPVLISTDDYIVVQIQKNWEEYLSKKKQ